MALNTTEAEQLRTAANDLAEKMRLERRIIIELRELFREITTDLQAAVELTGEPMNARIYADDFLGILSRHSRRVSSVFIGRILDSLDDEFSEDSIPDEEDNTVQALLLLAGALGTTVPDMLREMRASVRTRIREFNSLQAVNDTALITATNQRNMDLAVASATVTIEEETGIRPTNTAIALLASRTFLRRAFNRANIIATTFTQKIAENTKNTERQEFFNLRNGFNAIAQGLPLAEEIEMWQTQEDERVRAGLFNHVVANQQVKENGFFIVSGEQLAFPGDPNASMGNIAGCRCSAIVVIE